MYVTTNQTVVKLFYYWDPVHTIELLTLTLHENVHFSTKTSGQIYLLINFFCWIWMHQVDRGGAEVVIHTAGYEYIFRFESASPFSQCEAPRQQCWVWWRSALFKNACGCSIYRTSLGRWEWPATSLYLTSWVISSSQRRFRTPLISSIMGIHKDGVSLNTDGSGACFHGGGFRGLWEGRGYVTLMVEHLWLLRYNMHCCSSIH